MGVISTDNQIHEEILPILEDAIFNLKVARDDFSEITSNFGVTEANPVSESTPYYAIRNDYFRLVLTQLFTDRCRWQNFHPRMKVLTSATVVE